MNKQERVRREAVVQEALSWLNTPYHHAARVKGAGVDCGQLLLAVYEAVGMIPHVEPEAYPHDWHLHRGEERYLAHVQEHAQEIEGPPRPGDLVLYRFGRCLSHGAIVIRWPQILHAYVGLGVILDDAEANATLRSRQDSFWSCWGGGR